MTAEQQQVLFDNTARAMRGVPQEIQERGIGHCAKADPDRADRELPGPAGGNPRDAARLAAEVGITDIRAGLLPADKLDAVKAWQADGHRVLLVGDGVNETPAMAAADLGVAMGRRGSDLALETADAIIVRDELGTLATVIGLSRRARRVVSANLGFAATVIVALVTWDIAPALPLPLGVAGHEGSTVVVGLNGLRLLRAAASRRAAPRTPD
jgi:cation transport ATPase